MQQAKATGTTAVAAMHVKSTEQRHAHQQAYTKNIQTTQLLSDVPSNWLEDDYSQLLFTVGLCFSYTTCFSVFALLLLFMDHFDD